MSNNNTGDLIIEGLGSSNGGIFNTVKINGHGTISSDLDCQSFICNGIAKVNGILETNGATIQGILTISGNTKANHVKISGKTDINGSLFLDELYLDGDLAAKENLKASTFTGRGRISLKHLDAKTIDFHLFGPCKTHIITGDNIYIKKGHKNINIFSHEFNPLRSKLTTDSIEGNTIYIEHTNANIVKGKDIIIGPGCNIGHLEYENTFTQQDNDSSVAYSVKI